MDSLMLMLRVNVTLVYKNICIWFLKPICFATQNYIPQPIVWEALLYTIAARQKLVNKS